MSFGPTLPSLGAGGQVSPSSNSGFALTCLFLFHRCPVRPPALSHPGTCWREQPDTSKPHACPKPPAPSLLSKPHSH